MPAVKNLYAIVGILLSRPLWTPTGTGGMLERQLTPEEARKELILLVRQGRTIADGLRVIGRSRSWYDTQRREAEGFSALIDNARFRTQDLAQDARSNLSDFAEFSESILVLKYQGT